MLPRYKQLHETKSQPVFLCEKQNSVMTVLMKNPSWAVHFDTSDNKTHVVQKLNYFLPLVISVHPTALHPGTKLNEECVFTFTCRSDNGMNTML